MENHLLKGGETKMIAVKKHMVTAITVGAMLLATAAPAAFADTNISGNGAWSHNNVDTNQSNTTRLSQQNTSNISNDVSVTGNTGGNNANYNTGGNTEISTGSTYADVHISNMAGQNVANLSGLSNPWNQNQGDVWVSGNGAKSNNYVNQNSRNSLRVSQDNYANFHNNVYVKGNTGNNSASYNTGGQMYGMMHHGYGKGNYWNWGGGNNSDNQISTGDTAAHVMIDNMAGSNQLGN